MTKVSCSICGMKFSDGTRLERYAKKAHPPKQTVDPAPSSDFNHAVFPI